LSVIAGPDPDDPLSRIPPNGAGAASGGGSEADAETSGPRVGAPMPERLVDLTADARTAFAAARDRLAAAGAEIVDIHPAPLLEAGALLYGGAFVAERHAAVGAFVESHSDEVNPTVRRIIDAAATATASEYFADAERLDRLALATRALFADLDAILLPTTVAQPTIGAVEADPIGENAKLAPTRRAPTCSTSAPSPSPPERPTAASSASRSSPRRSTTPSPPASQPSSSPIPPRPRPTPCPLSPTGRQRTGTPLRKMRRLRSSLPGRTFRGCR